MNQYELLWGAAIVVFAVVEALTSGLVSIWFAVGALAGLIAAIFGANIWIQGASFVAVSVIFFIFLRSRAIKSTSRTVAKTDIDRIIGKEVIITQTIDNNKKSGKTEINDVEWKVKSSNGEVINSGETAIVERIEGVSLIVTK